MNVVETEEWVPGTAIHDESWLPSWSCRPMVEIIDD